MTGTLPAGVFDQPEIARPLLEGRRVEIATVTATAQADPVMPLRFVVCSGVRDPAFRARITDAENGAAGAIAAIGNAFMTDERCRAAVAALAAQADAPPLLDMAVALAIGPATAFNRANRGEAGGPTLDWTSRATVGSDDPAVATRVAENVAAAIRFAIHAAWVAACAARPPAEA